jgi:hypothetical protein
MQLFQHVDVPFEIELAHAVVGDCERARTGVTGEIQIIALDRDQVAPVRLDHTEGACAAAWLPRRSCCRR